MGQHLYLGKAVLTVLWASVCVQSMYSTESRDWPGWRGPNGNGAAADQTWVWDASSGSLAWKMPAGVGLSCPIVADKRVFVVGTVGPNDSMAPVSGKQMKAMGLGRNVGDPGEVIIRCLQLSDGKLVWEKRHPSWAMLIEKHMPGSMTTPAYADGKLYVRQRNHIFRCMDADNGETLWQVDLSKDFQFPKFIKQAPNHGWEDFTSPFVRGGVVVLGGPAPYVAIGLDAQSGSKRWQYRDEGRGYVWSSPMPGPAANPGSVLLSYSGKKVVCLNLSDGSVIWNLTPQFSDRGGNRSGWSYKDPAIVDDQLVFFSGSNQYGIYDVSAVKPKELLGDQQAVGIRKLSNPIVYDGYLYNEVIIRMADGSIVEPKQAISLPNRAIRVADRLLGFRNAKPRRNAMGAMVILHAAGPDSRIDGEFEILSPMSYTAPVFASGRVLLRTADHHVACYQLMKQ